MAYLCGSNVGDSSGNLGERFGSERGKALRERDEIYEGNLWKNSWKLFFTSKKYTNFTLLYIQKGKRFCQEISNIFTYQKKKKNIKYLRHGNCRRFDFNLSKAGSPDSEFGFLKLI